MVSLKNGFFARSGNAASIVPAGHRYLQKYGGAIPILFVKNIGSAITITIKTTYLRYLSLESTALLSLNFGVGILKSRS